MAMCLRAYLDASRWRVRRKTKTEDHLKGIYFSAIDASASDGNPEIAFVDEPENDLMHSTSYRFTTKMIGPMMSSP